jgi:hypothetical protein
VGLEFTMGPGSGSSPGISPDGSAVYVVDGNGVLFAVDAESGMAKWSLATNGQPASPSVGADGKIYLLGGRAGLAINADGTRAWKANLDDLARQMVPALGPDSGLEGPSTFNNAIPTITESGILTSVTVGYLTSLGTQTLAPVPVQQIVVLLDPRTGERIETFDPLRPRDTVEGFVVPSLEGTIYVNQGALVSSTMTALASVFQPQLPSGVSLMAPVGGLQAFTPIGIPSAAP